MTEFLVKHFAHSRPTITLPMTAAKYTEPYQIGEAIPVNLQYGITLDGSDFCTYEIPMQNPMAKWQQSEPYISDFSLYRDGLPFMSGITTGIGFKPNSGLLSVSGKNWRHWLERRIYPFDMPSVAADFDPTFTRTATDTITIAWDLIEDTSLNAVYSLGGSNYAYVGVMITEPVFLGTSGLVIDYKIDYADEESIASKVDDLSKRHPGFDWFIDFDRVFRVVAPYRGRDRTYIILEEGVNVTGTDFSNDGILASRTYATGQGTSQKMMDIGEHSGTTYFFRLMEKFVDFGEISSQSQIYYLAQGEDLRSVHGIEMITTTVIPQSFDFHANVQIGDLVKVRIPTSYFPSGYIGGGSGATRRIVNIAGSVDNEGNETITLTLDNSHEAYL
jgi:hypothetical protein